MLQSLLQTRCQFKYRNEIQQLQFVQRMNTQQLEVNL
ncbi:hypothetical protein pb186bvf_019987 [Paramecium bursaria]